MKYRPRNDFVLLRRVKIDRTKEGLVMPDISEEGYITVIEAIGPTVEDLEVGDQVMAIGSPGVDLVVLKTDRNLFMTKEANVLVVLEKE